MCLFKDLQCFFMGSREITLVPSRDGNYENDVEEKQEVNFEHLFSFGISKAMAFPSALLIILLSTPHCLVGNLFSSGDTVVYLLEHPCLVRTPESFLSGDFIHLTLCLKLSIIHFLCNFRRKNLKVNQRLSVWCYCIEKADVFSLSVHKSTF